MEEQRRPVISHMQEVCDRLAEQQLPAIGAWAEQEVEFGLDDHTRWVLARALQRAAAVAIRATLAEVGAQLIEAGYDVELIVAVEEVDSLDDDHYDG